MPKARRPTIEEIYHRSSGRVYSTLLRLSGDSVVADQLTQDVFVSAWRSLPSFRGESSIETWLHRITVRTHVDHIRARRRWEDQLVEDAEAEPHLVRQPGLSADDRVDLEEAIASLPTGARTILVLHDIEGYKYEEIAVLLEIAIGTVKSQLHRARALLIEAMKP